MGWLSIDEDEIADAVRRIFGTPGGTNGNEDGSSGAAPQPRAGIPPDASGGGWYDPLPSEGPYAIGKTPDLNNGEGMQPFVTGINGRGYMPKDGDRDSLARIMFAESGNSPEDYPAIGWTVINRVGDKQFRSTLDGVISQANGTVKQFDGYRSPQWDKASDPGSLTGPDALSYSRAVQAAGDILSGNISDPTGGANYFHAGTTPSPFFQSRIDSGRFVPIPIGISSSFYRDTKD